MSKLIDINALNKNNDYINNNIIEIKDYIGYTDDDIYGLEADYENGTFTRLAGAIGKTSGSDFDIVNAYGGRRRCNLTDNGIVTAYYGDEAYTETGTLTQAVTVNNIEYSIGTAVQVMVEQPKFYYRVVPLKLEKYTTQNGDTGYHIRKARYYISDTPKNGFKLHPAFIRNGAEKEKIYLSAYEGCLYDTSENTYITDDAQVAGSFNIDKMCSIANAKPMSGSSTQKLTRANARKLAQNRGTGWEQQYIHTVSASQLLFVIEYASFNSQSSIGSGVIGKTGSENKSENTGNTSSLGNASGVGNNSCVTYRGEENLWGNIWKWEDGINVKNPNPFNDGEYGNVYVADNNFTDDISAYPYEDTNIYPCKTPDGYISAFGYNEKFDWLFIPTEAEGNSSLPVGDNLRCTSLDWRVTRCGESCFGNSGAGIFAKHFNGNSSTSYSYNISARLVYIPNADESVHTLQQLDTDLTAAKDKITDVNNFIESDLQEKTVSGELVHIIDAAACPAKECVTILEPKQEGTGTPSPENVRPITGYTGAKVIVSSILPNNNGLIELPPPVQEGSEIASPENIRPISAGLSFKRDDGSTLDIYGGTVDLINGILKVTSTKKIFDGTEQWSISSSNVVYTEANMKSGNNMNGLCSKLPTGVSHGMVRFGLNNNNNIYIVGGVNDYGLDSLTKAQEFTSGMEIVYPLKTQITYQLTPTEINRIKALLKINTYSMTFPTSAGTVYGGEIDWVNGVLKVTKAMVDLGDLSWSKETSDIMFRSTSPLSNVKAPVGALDVPNAVCSAYEIMNYSDLTQATMGATIVFETSSYAGQVWMNDSNYDNVTEFKEAMQGVKLCYELATPITYQFTPQQIEMLRGENNIWSSDGTTSIKYAIDNISAYIDRIDDMQDEITDIKGFIDYTDNDIYGLEVDFQNNVFTRLASAVGKSGGNDFNNINAYGGRRRCNLTDNGIVTAYYGDEGYTETGALTQAVTVNGVEYTIGTAVQVMVEQPKFYYKVVPLKLESYTTQNGDIGYHIRKAAYYIADTPKNGFKLHPAFIRNGAEKEKIYLSAYEGSLYDVSENSYITDNTQIADFTTDKMSSIANVKPMSGSQTEKLTRSNARKLAENRGAGWEQMYIHTVSASQLLFIIEYASFNSQSSIGNGVTNKAAGSGNEAENTGGTSSLGNTNGSVNNGEVSYRGEENLWGNIWKWEDGINIHNPNPFNNGEYGKVYVSDNTFTDDISAYPYEDTNIYPCRANATYISAFGYNEKFDWIFIPTEATGNSSLPVGDGLWNTVSDWTVSQIGARWSSGAKAGILAIAMVNQSKDYTSTIGARLVYIPNANENGNSPKELIHTDAKGKTVVENANGVVLEHTGGAKIEMIPYFTSSRVSITSNSILANTQSFYLGGTNAKITTSENSKSIKLDTSMKGGTVEINGGTSDNGSVTIKGQTIFITDYNTLNWGFTEPISLPDYIRKQNTIATTYSELKTLCDNGTLKAGVNYRITDYVTTTVQPETQSAGNQFDIIVVADSSNTLNENARAIQHTTSSSDYFYGQKLNSWKLKYDINNDTDKYAWADTTNGKGVIYSLEDEYGNKCGYDFKNIQFKFYKITASDTERTEKCTGLFNTFSASRKVSSNINQDLVPTRFTIDSNSYEFRYTFDYYNSNTHKDFSLNIYNNSTDVLCYSNEIYPLFGDWNYNNNKKRYLNIISFRNSNYNYKMYGNILKSRNFNNSFGNSCSSNSFGNNCDSNSFGNSCSYNSFSDNCSYNSFSDNCSDNSFGNDYKFNSFGNTCSDNSFGNDCNTNSFGNSCDNNSFGNDCRYNSFGDSCDSNSFGNDCYDNSFGNSCYNNSFGNSCDRNSFGNRCDRNSFGNSCIHNSFGDNCSYNSFVAEESNFNVFEYVTYKTFTETIRFTKLFGPYFDIEFDYGSWAEYEDDETGETVVYGINDTYCKIIDYHGESDFTGKIKMILYSDNDTSLIETYESNVTIPNNAHDYYIIENDSLYFDTEPNPGETDIYCIFELYDSNNNLIWSDYYSW